MTLRPRARIFTMLGAVALALLAVHCAEESAPTGGVAQPDATTTADTSIDPPGTTDAANEGGDAAATACPAGFEDLNATAADGCETKTPVGLDKNALGVWLRADRGLACTNGKVVTWADQSGRGRNATAIAGHRAPACAVFDTWDAAAAVPSFAADGVDAATPVDAGRWDEDTLAIDLSFLANTAYTIIAVDRRRLPNKDFSFFLGTGVPTYDDYGAANTDRGLHVGYRFEGLFWFDQFNNATMTSVQTLDAGAGADAGSGPLRWTFARNPGTGDAGNLNVLRSDWAGAMAGDGGTATLMPAAAEGRLGRGFGNTNLDTRFRGDLAELVVFTRALSDAELAEMMQYLQRHWGL